MVTDKIQIDSQGMGIEDALREVERFCAYSQLNAAQSLHMRLLAEETISLLRELTYDFTGECWASKEGQECRIHVEGRALMTDERRWELMNVSSTGNNVLAKGVLGKIAAFFDLGLSSAAYTPGASETMDYGMMSLQLAFAADATATGGAMWSLSQYRKKVKEAYNEGAAAVSEAWDELQKSIIANVADDVQVGILGGKVHMTVSKHFEI